MTKRGPVYIWDAPIDDWARTAVDIGTDFIPIVSTLKSVYDAVQRLDNGEDTFDVLMSSGAEGLLGLIPGGKAGKRLGDAVDAAADVADAAGDLRKAARGSHITSGAKQGRQNRVDWLEVNEFEPTQPKHVRGWLKNERRRIESGNGSPLPRNPPGYVQAHGRSTPAREGFDYSNSRLQHTDLNRLEESVRRRTRRP
ncbi:hypothetical protein [Paraliomyxa miuraensis]|uniref:hypothetical protein n=1 Tax=Paraliomyxa miuraensis TaxID=376150 RepID=UPI00224EC1B1|nr:hypothetical protein [Paraliomyxa miuraensis]MCX4240086.1 hypothetical protein [Paraliomyxa miuraensis]